MFLQAFPQLLVHLLPPHRICIAHRQKTDRRNVKPRWGTTGVILASSGVEIVLSLLKSNRFPFSTRTERHVAQSQTMSNTSITLHVDSDGALPSKSVPYGKFQRYEQKDALLPRRHQHVSPRSLAYFVTANGTSLTDALFSDHYEQIRSTAIRMYLT